MGSATTANDAIISTLAFFALFSRPLLAEEVVQYAYTQDHITKEEILRTLQESSAYWYTANGYHYLTAAKYTRSVKDQSEVSEQYIAKAKKYIPALRNIPYVRSVSVVNTVAFGSAKRESDIDLFIITAPGKLWIARFFVTIWLHMAGVRRHGARTQGRFCLSFFIDETENNLSPIALPNGDMYLSFWMATMIPVWNSKEFSSFIKANTKGLLKNFPLREEISALMNPPSSIWQARFEKMCEMSIFAWLQKVIVAFQKIKMKYLPVSQNIYSSVVVRDSMLKFHNNDRRSRYQVSWKTLVHNALHD